MAVSCNISTENRREFPLEALGTHRITSKKQKSLLGDTKSLRGSYWAPSWKFGSWLTPEGYRLAVKFMIFVSNLGELGGCCQGNLIPLYFWGQFLRKIGGFKILEIVANPERCRRAVSPTCPAIVFTRRRKQRRRGKESPGFDRAPW